MLLVLILQVLVQTWPPVSKLAQLLSWPQLLSLQSRCGTLPSSVMAHSTPDCVYGLSPGQHGRALRSRALSQGLAQSLAPTALANCRSELNVIGGGRPHTSMALIIQMAWDWGPGRGCVLEQVWRRPASRRHLCLSTFQSLWQSPQAKGLKDYNIYGSLAVNPVQNT